MTSHSRRSVPIAGDGTAARGCLTVSFCRRSMRMAVCYGIRMNVRTNLMLPEELVHEVDHFAGPRARSRYVAEALEMRLKRDRLREAVEATAGALSAEDYPHWATSEQVVDWVRALRAEDTDPWVETT